MAKEWIGETDGLNREAFAWLRAFRPALTYRLCSLACVHQWRGSMKAFLQRISERVHQLRQGQHERRSGTGDADKEDVSGVNEGEEEESGIPGYRELGGGEDLDSFSATDEALGVASLSVKVGLPDGALEDGDMSLTTTGSMKTVRGRLGLMSDVAPP